MTACNEICFNYNHSQNKQTRLSKDSVPQLAHVLFMAFFKSLMIGNFKQAFEPLFGLPNTQSPFD